MPELFQASLWARWIEFGAYMLVTARCLGAAGGLLRHRDPGLGGRAVATGVLEGLTWLVAASLLKLVTLHGWDAIERFALIFLLRTLLKQALKRELRFWNDKPELARQAPQGR